MRNKRPEWADWKTWGKKKREVKGRKNEVGRNENKPYHWVTRGHRARMNDKGIHS